MLSIQRGIIRQGQIAKSRETGLSEYGAPLPLACIFASMKRERRWWNRPISGIFATRAGGLVIGFAVAIFVEILASPAARVWFGLLIISALAIAVILRKSNKNSEL
jgi:hypothetical protein